MEDFISKLKPDVQCSLCNDTLTEPKILKCFHTFCKPCIKRHAELIQEVNVFKCPKCKSETSLPELNSVDDLKPSVLHSRMVKVLEFVESEKVCSVFGSHPPASWHCLDCNRSLCDECEKGHSMFTKDHKTTWLKNVRKEDVELMLRGGYCQDHEAKYHFYCKDCEKCLCIECLRECGIHNTIHLQDVMSSKRSSLQEVSDHLKVKRKETKKEIKTLKKMVHQGKKSGEQAKAEVQGTVKRLIAWLEESEKELVAEIEKKMEKAEQIQLQALAVLNQNQSVQDYIGKVMENGDVNEMNEILKDMEGYDHDSCIKKPNWQEACFEFVCSKEVNKIRNSGIGILKPMLTDPQMSLVQIKSKDLQAQNNFVLVVLTKTSSGNLNFNPDDVVDVEIISKDGVKIETKTIRTDGKIEVEFMSKVAGQLRAEVQVNGKHVSNSPLQLVTTINASEFKMKEIDTKSSEFTGIAVNKENTKVAVADGSMHRVYVFNLSGDLLLTYGSQGNGQDELNNPQGLAFLNETDLVIADFGNDRICIVSTATGTLVRTFGQRGSCTGQFKYPRGVHVDDDNIVVSDYHNHRLQVFTNDGKTRTECTNQSCCFDPVGTVIHDGRYYVLDDNSCSIHVFEKKKDELVKISTVGTRGSADGQLTKPRGLTIDNDHHLLICDGGNNRIQIFTLDGSFLGTKDIPNPRNIAVLKGDQFLVTAGKKVVLFSEQISLYPLIHVS